MAIRYVEYTPKSECGFKYFCVFVFNEQKDHATLMVADYHEYEDEWYYCECYTKCDYDKIEDNDYLEKLFDENENNGFSSGSYNSLEELISMEAKEDANILLLSHFCKEG